MPVSNFAPDLSSFAGDYQILTALRTAPDSITYLARHLKLNRDVTITVTRLSGDDTAVDRFAEDAKMLSVMRHRSVIPVIEGRRLSDGSFAIVRARVRGQTLEQLVANVGAMPVARVATTLEQVHSAIEWARQNRIANRHVSADAIVFQQGSGRVLLELEPSAKAGMADACDDARTIGRLAYEMLSGHREGTASPKPLAEARPDLSPRIVKETEALMQCDTNRGARDAISLITLLSGKSEKSESVAPPAAPRLQRKPVAIPAGPLDSAVVVVKRPFGYAARLATAVAVVAIIGTLGIVLLNRRGNDSVPRTTAGEVAATKAVAGGEVIRPVPSRPDTPISRPPTGAPVPPTQAPVSAPVPMVVAPARSDTIPPVTNPTQTRPKPPVTRRSEPPRGMAPSKMPNPVVPPRDTIVPVVVKPPDTVATSAVTPDGCDSPDSGAQRACLSAALERNDRELNSTYQRLIAALRRQAGVGQSDADPPNVDVLRDAQRAWITSRDVACRDAGTGPLWAKARADCFAGQSARRTEELTRRLRAVPEGDR